MSFQNKLRPSRILLLLALPILALALASCGTSSDKTEKINLIQATQCPTDLRSSVQEERKFPDDAFFLKGQTEEEAEGTGKAFTWMEANQVDLRDLRGRAIRAKTFCDKLAAGETQTLNSKVSK